MVEQQATLQSLMKEALQTTEDDYIKAGKRWKSQLCSTCRKVKLELG